jgi:acyl-CoA synthetase (AMP-forming)/AMP-acid ligase II
MIVNLVVRRVKKMVPPFSIPGTILFNDAVAAGRGMKFSKPKIGPDDVAFLQYTGGTTGISKGATLLHRNILPTCCRTMPGCSRRWWRRRMSTRSSSSARCRSITSSR